MLIEKPVERSGFLVVGVDFGTTYTGVAYAHSEVPDPNRIAVITKWPGAGTQTRPKVPTEIGTLPSGKRGWGWQLRAGMKRFGGFKLLLDPKAGDKAYNDEQLLLTLDPGDPSARSQLREGESATDMATEYLALIYEEVMTALGRRFPNSLGGLKIKFIITTPAMWSRAAQHNTLMAARAAGFGSRPQDHLEPVTEPEAAACYAMKEVNVSEGQVACISDSASWQPDRQIIICDAGGGTVDLVTYAIDQVHPFLKVLETVPPRGGFCGATSLDERFLQLLRRRLGRQARLLDGPRAGRGSRLMQSFDDVKRNFGTSHYEEGELIEHGIRGIREDIDNGIEEEYIKLSHDDMKSIFDPVIDKVLTLIQDMAKEARRREPTKPVTGIILVGGFGESMYLTQRLKRWASRQSPPVFLCNPNESWAAIAKGAVCYGLEGIVHRRVLPCHYGAVLDSPFDADIHDPNYTYTSRWSKELYSSDGMEWFAKMVG
ncbi:hypothetical protein B0T14DRAFT_566081 [Immersiella caudata]|uniref:Actin-like ATPase domain-containing protein n=1 Tax=Immersiella caudata TaxID=314043 RepID=A0AA39WPH6_9PEZI|nr:hypothetical protein B0T14DRAFT_566081 [Immersiella caudata]